MLLEFPPGLAIEQPLLENAAVTATPAIHLINSRRFIIALLYSAVYGTERWYQEVAINPFAFWQSRILNRHLQHEIHPGQNVYVSLK
jgi:hypothetical protein